MLDTDKTEASFYSYCLEAGAACNVYRSNDTEDSIKDRVEGVYQALKREPVSGLSAANNLPFILTHDQLKYSMFAALYAPNVAFPGMAVFLDALHRKDYQRILQMVPVIYPSYKPFCDSSIQMYPSRDAQLAIMCTDKRYPLDESLPNLEKRFEDIANVSRFADVWMAIMVGCNAYNITPTDPPMRWTDHPAHKRRPIKTSFPLLFLSNRADPVTPLYAGVKMARRFVDAGLVEQESEGHCSLAAVSRCTMEWIRGYFEEGKVPDHPKWGTDGKEIETGTWERCEADEQPWKAFNGKAWMEKVEREERQKVHEGLIDPEDVQIILEEEGKEAKIMEAWRDSREFTRAFFGPGHAVLI